LRRLITSYVLSDVELVVLEEDLLSLLVVAAAGVLELEPESELLEEASAPEPLSFFLGGPFDPAAEPRA
jgi:hypothetical protein